jgi:hypothetical protein
MQEAMDGHRRGNTFVVWRVRDLHRAGFILALAYACVEGYIPWPSQHVHPDVLRPVYIRMELSGMEYG